MLCESDINLIKKLDDERRKGIKSITEEFGKYMEADFGNDVSIIQLSVNEIYQNLSYAGIEKFDKVIAAYNKEHPDQTPLKAHADIAKEYQPAVDNGLAFFISYGEKYGNENRMMDKFMRSRFEEIMSDVNDVNKQDVVDAISKGLNERINAQGYITDTDVKIKSNFEDIVKNYSESKEIRLRITDFDKAADTTKELTDMLKIPEGLSKEDEAIVREKANNDFKYGIVEYAKHMKGDDFQAVIDNLDRSLDFEGRKMLDKAVRYSNKNNHNKFETRRVKLTEREKDMSWQKFDSRSIISRKFKQFKEEWKDLKYSKEIPKDKYDAKGINKLLIDYTNIQMYIAKALDSLAKLIDYYANNNKDETEKDASDNQAKESKNTNKESESGEQKDKTEKSDDYSAFYDIIKDAYKESGYDLTAMVNSGRMDVDAAEDLFITTVAYAKVQNPEKYEELSKMYAEGLSGAASNQNISFETKQTIRGFVMNLTSGKYENEINQKIKDGIDWGDVLKAQEKRLSNDEISKLSERASDIGIEIIKKAEKEGFINDNDKIMDEYYNKMTEFRQENPRLTTKQFAVYTHSVASIILAYSKDPELASKMSKFDDKDYKAESDKSNIKSVLAASVLGDFADKISDRVDENTIHGFQTGLHKMLSDTLDKIPQQEQKQEFITSIADSITNDNQKFMLAVEAKSLGLSISTAENFDIDGKAKRMLQTYMFKAENPQNIGKDVAYRNLVVFSEQAGAQKQAFISELNKQINNVKPDELKDKIKASFEKDCRRYNLMNNKFKQQEVSLPDFEVADKKRGIAIEHGEAMQEAREIAVRTVNIINKNPNQHIAAMADMLTNLALMPTKYPQLDRNKMSAVQKAGIAVFLTKVDEDMKKTYDFVADKTPLRNMSKTFANDKDGKYTIGVLLRAAANVNFANLQSGNINKDNNLKTDFSEALKSKLDTLSKSDSQKYVADISDGLSTDSILKNEFSRYMLISELRDSNIRPESTKFLQSEKEISESCKSLIDKYTQRANGSRINTYKGLVVLSQTTPSVDNVFGADRIKEALFKEVENIKNDKLRENVSKEITSDLEKYEQNFSRDENVFFVDVGNHEEAEIEFGTTEDIEH